MMKSTHIVLLWLYHIDFESAIEYYQSIGPIQGDSDEIKEFNSIMEFLYLGRKSIKDLKE